MPLTFMKRSTVMFSCTVSYEKSLPFLSAQNLQYGESSRPPARSFAVGIGAPQLWHAAAPGVVNFMMQVYSVGALARASTGMHCEQCWHDFVTRARARVRCSEPLLLLFLCFDRGDELVVLGHSAFNDSLGFGDATPAKQFVLGRLDVEYPREELLDLSQ